MTDVQIISKVLNTKSISLITDNNLTEEYFTNYPEEYRFLLDHYSTYGNVPDVETFLNKFPSFSVLNVIESDQYLLDTIREEYQYTKVVPVVNRIAELLQTNSYSAVEYLQSMLPELVASNGGVVGHNIIKDAKARYDEFLDRQSGKSVLLHTGFNELDEIIGGLNKGEEFVVLLARTGEGKTWILLKMLEYLWRTKLTVALIEPEMSYNRIGYRFDTLNANISNTALLRGKNIDYKSYIDRLTKNKIPFYVATPKDFGRAVTVSKLRNFCIQNKVDVLGIDGLSYLRDERGKRGDNKTTTLTNISEDLMDLSVELQIPVIAVVQSNRLGMDANASPEVENIRDSDGIAHNASMIISIKQKEPGVELTVKKHRNGINNAKVLYAWDIDKGTFLYIPATDDNTDNSERVENQRKRFRDRGESI